VASGHGIGKTALVAWIIHWFISTRPNPQIIVTANTQTQLSTKTWRELAKWHSMSIHKDWFEWTATRFYMKGKPETWFASAIPWSMQNSEAFAGAHERYVLFIFDEASAIHDKIWEVSEGAMTTPGAMWMAFGNPTRNTGRFRECWTTFAKRWIKFNIDSRTAKMANKKQLQEWLDDYGEDSDFARVRVKGEFPRAGSMQFISSEAVDLATNREVVVPYGTPKIMGVDVARFGDDKSVISRRHGRKCEEMIKYQGLDTMTYAAKVAGHINEFKPDLVAVDGIGIGAGVVDRLRQLGFSIVEIHAGSKAMDETVYYNLRIEMWAKMRDWLATGSIPKDSELRQQLIGPEFGFDNKMRMQLEKKEDMKKRGLDSPDCGDALALTFAYPNPPVRGLDERPKEPEWSYDV